MVTVSDDGQFAWSMGGHGERESQKLLNTAVVVLERKTEAIFL